MTILKIKFSLVASEDCGCIPGRAPLALSFRSAASGSFALPVARFTEVMKWRKFVTISSTGKCILLIKLKKSNGRKGTKTYRCNRSTDVPCFVGSPLTGALKSRNVSCNVFCDGSSTFGRHETQWTQKTTKFWSDSSNQGWNTENCGRSDSIIKNLRRSRQKMVKSEKVIILTNPFNQLWTADNVCPCLSCFLGMSPFCKYKNFIFWS